MGRLRRRSCTGQSSRQVWCSPSRFRRVFPKRLQRLAPEPLQRRVRWRREPECLLRAGARPSAFRLIDFASADGPPSTACTKPATDPCPFGCPHALDRLEHYRVCEQLRRGASRVLPSSPPVRWTRRWGLGGGRSFERRRAVLFIATASSVSHALRAQRRQGAALPFLARAVAEEWRAGARKVSEQASAARYEAM